MKLENKDGLHVRFIFLTLQEIVPRTTYQNYYLSIFMGRLPHDMQSSLNSSGIDLKTIISGPFSSFREKSEAMPGSTAGLPMPKSIYL